MSEAPLIPYDWQLEDIDWLGRQNSLLASDCGTGKTLIAVETAKKYAQGPILVICPRLTKEFWAETIRRQQAGFPGVCGRSGRDIPWSRIAKRGSRKPLAWVIVHPAAVRLAYKKMLRVRWDTIIVDEAHRMKNRQAKQTRALWKLDARRKILLTATPYGKSPADMWALLHYLYPKKYRSYWKFFDKYVEYYKPHRQRFRIVQGGKNLEELAAEISPYYRRRGIERLNLPPFTYTDAPVIINPKQEALYLQLVRDAYAELVGKEIILQNALVRFIRLQQCALDPGIIVDFEDPLDEVPAKVEWLRDWLSDHPGEPVIITSRFRKFVAKWLVDLAPKAVIVGGMKISAVQKALKEFEKSGMLVGTLDAIKEGLNLQKANTMIIMDGTWSSTAEYQLSKRIHRVGQTRPCQVIHLVGKLSHRGRGRWTVDKLMRRAVEKKFGDAQLMNSFIKELWDGN